MSKHLVTGVLLVLLAPAVLANNHCPSRTYFGWPQSPNPLAYRQPCTFRILGVRYHKTPEMIAEEYRCQAEALRVHHQDQLDRSHGSFGCGYYPTVQPCPEFDPCGKGCKKPHGWCQTHYDPVPPGMTREDALRYLEGFLYYPPYHVVRSPRDFFMFDVKYDTRR